MSVAGPTDLQSSSRMSVAGPTDLQSSSRMSVAGPTDFRGSGRMSVAGPADFQRLGHMSVALAPWLLVKGKETPLWNVCATAQSRGAIFHKGVSVFGRSRRRAFMRRLCPPCASKQSPRTQRQQRGRGHRGCRGTCRDHPCGEARHQRCWWR